MKYKIITTTALVLLLGLGGLKAQNTALTAGGEATGSGGTVSFSVGQPVYSTAAGTNGTLAQGVQQAFEIIEITGLDAPKSVGLDFIVYPNPTANNLIIKTKNGAYSDFSYRLYDLNGRVIDNKKITAPETNIAMMGLNPATYFIKILQSDTEIKAFKIIKK